MKRGEGDLKSVLITALVILGLMLALAQLCFWWARTVEPQPEHQKVAVSTGCAP